MTSYPLMPGVPAAGHVTTGGYWHPGSPDDCPKCDTDPPTRRSTMTTDPITNLPYAVNAESGEWTPLASELPVRYVNAYRVTLGYGGPEEGGWWYDLGEPLASIPVRTPEQEAQARALIASTIAPDFDGTPDKSSVMPNAASLTVCTEDEIAAEYPTERPFYE